MDNSAMHSNRTWTILLSCALAGALQAQRVGVVLSGGGAPGMAHVGVLKALEEHGIPIDYIAGSSMGALVGGLYAAGYSPMEIDSLFRSEQFRIMADGGVEHTYLHFAKQDAPDAALMSLRFDLDTTLQTSLPTNLRSPVLLDLEQMRGFAPAAALAGYDLDSLFVPFRCVASDITAQRPVVFRDGDLAQAVRASMSYPFYFKPIRVNGHLMMDGGLYNNFPSDVMYADFLPDIVIGSNVSSNSAPPSEDDLLSQLRAMMQEPTNFSVICENGVIIEPRTGTPLFDFTDPSVAINEGYQETLRRMPEIKAQLQRSRTPAEVALRRQRFRARQPELRFGDIRVHGLDRRQTHYVDRILRRRPGNLTYPDLKQAYFLLYADRNIALLYPKATFDPRRSVFDIDLHVKPEKDLEVRFGGMFSSRPINTGMVGLRYNLFGRSSACVDALSYFGKFYAAGQVKLRLDLPWRTPAYLEPHFNLHRWDHFRSFSTFFDEVKPSFVVVRETYAGNTIGVGLGNKGLVRLDMRVAETKDSYYQSDAFSGQDTSDITQFRHATAGMLLMRNSLNRKQHANAGEELSLSVRYVTGTERTDLGTTRPLTVPLAADHAWLMLRGRVDQYLMPRGTVRVGYLLEGVFSDMPMFHNYTATIIRAPAFQPTPESRTYFIPEFRTTKYLAGGVRTIMAVARDKFDLRLEGYIFQPYEPIVRGGDDQGITAPAFTQRYFIGSGSLIYQSPLGPVWFNMSYFDGLRIPWAWSLNFGYVLFNERAQE
jgi:NTE family protein